MTRLWSSETNKKPRFKLTASPGRVLFRPPAGGERRGHHGAGSQLPGPNDHHPSDLPTVEGHQRPLHEEQPPHLLTALRSTGGLPAIPGGNKGGEGALWGLIQITWWYGVNSQEVGGSRGGEGRCKVKERWSGRGRDAKESVRCTRLDEVSGEKIGFFFSRSLTCSPDSTPFIQINPLWCVFTGVTHYAWPDMALVVYTDANQTNGNTKRGKCRTWGQQNNKEENYESISFKVWNIKKKTCKIEGCVFFSVALAFALYIFSVHRTRCAVTVVE